LYILISERSDKFGAKEDINAWSWLWHRGGTCLL